MSVHSGPTLHKKYFLYNVVSDMFGQHWLDKTITRHSLDHVVPAWSIQCCVYFLYKLSVAKGQHSAGKNLVQCWPRDSRQHCTRKKIHIKCYLNTLGQHGTGKSLVQCCPRGSREHFTKKILFDVFLILLGQHCTGIYPMQYCLCNIVLKAQNNNAHRKRTHFNAVLIPVLGQHCTHKNLLHFRWKNPFQLLP